MTFFISACEPKTYNFLQSIIEDMNHSCVNVTSASLRIFAHRELHRELTHVLGTKPQKYKASGYGIKAPTGVWVATASVNDQKPLSVHLSWIVKRLSGHRAYLTQLQQQGIDADVFCV